jgi:hypothetical protein
VGGGGKSHEFGGKVDAIAPHPSVHGGSAMTLIGEFDPADQLLLMQGLEAAAVLISTASLGRKEETASEGIAMATYVLDSAKDQIAYPLLTSILRELEDRAGGGGAFPDYGKVVTAPDARDRARGVVRSAVTAVNAVAIADEAAAYRAWLLGIATAVAKAGKEDQGFLGRGGVMVNDAERAALAELAEMLGLEAPAV